MTIPEAQAAARKNTPVVYDDPMLGPMLFARIASIRKDFALRRDVERGKPAEVYALELWGMDRQRSVTVVPPDRVREATPEELADVRQYGGRDGI